MADTARKRKTPRALGAGAIAYPMRRKTLSDDGRQEVYEQQGTVPRAVRGRRHKEKGPEGDRQRSDAQKKIYRLFR